MQRHHTIVHIRLLPKSSDHPMNGSYEQRNGGAPHLTRYARLVDACELSGVSQAKDKTEDPEL
ncbi:hypothetical protein RRF57_002028 [Xylaria bambusicola]|uniref:Uncharacterized protein n=1 Tax=Xylaria bambusicola TaxID=326684 RepID=A0AAN7UDW7_9PEZI